MSSRAARGVFTAVLLAVASSVAADPSSTSRLHWVTNGTVRAAAVHDQTLYIGGSFTRVAPAANFLGPWFSVSRTMGAAGPRLPLADGAVLAIEPDGVGGYYVGGRFTRIGGVARTALAHVLTDGSIDAAFAPVLAPAFSIGPIVPAALDVRAIARVGDLVLVGGSFRATGSVTRDGFAAFQAATGALRPEFGSPPGTPAGSLLVHKILVDGGAVYVMGESRVLMLPLGPNVIAMGSSGTPFWTSSLGAVFDGVVAGGRLIVGGSFRTAVGSSEIWNLASLNPATGAIDPAWSPVPATLPPTVRVLAVTAIGSTVYIGGDFNRLGTLPRSNLAAVDLASGTLTGWAPQVDGIVRDLAPASGASVYVAGEFQHVGGHARSALAEIDAAGAGLGWIPQAHATGVATVHVSPGVVVGGGTSAVADGVARDRLAALSLATDDVLPWAPVNPDGVIGLVTDGARIFATRQRTVDGTVRVSAVAFDSSGAESAWTAPSEVRQLLAVFDGHVYLNLGGDAPATVRVDAVTGAPDPSWRLDIGVTKLLPSGERVYLIDPSSHVHNEHREHLAVLDRTTGALGSWNPTGLPTNPGATTQVLDAVLDGQTMYVSHLEPFSGVRAITGIDTDSATSVSRLQTLLAAERLATADGVLIAVGTPAVAGATAVMSFRADGSPSGWSPGLFLTDLEPFDSLSPSFPRRPAVLTTPADVVIAGMQALDETSPVHGIAVFARDPPPAPSGLDAEVTDTAVRLSWIPPVPAPPSYVIEVGSSPSASDILVQDTRSAVPMLDAVAPPGLYFVRVRASGTVPGSPEAVPSNEVAVRTGCVAAPAPPLNLVATMSGTLVSLQWSAPAVEHVASYVIEAGSGPGLTNLARLAVPGALTTFTTDAPRGTYHVRVRAVNSCGASRPTPDIWLTVGDDVLPAAPGTVTITTVARPPTAAHGLYNVAWSPVPGATAYLLEVGSRPGLADFASVILLETAIGPGAAAWGQSYFLRVRAINAAGVGPPSVEQVVTVR